MVRRASRRSGPEWTEYIREVASCFGVFCLLLGQEACESDDIRIDLLLANRRLVIAVGSRHIGLSEQRVVLKQ